MTPVGLNAVTTGSSGDCPAGELTLANVRRVGSRVRLSGLAERTLAGAPVEIVEAGQAVARTTIAADGRFAVRASVPAKRGGRTLRYQARIGALRSRNLRLQRRMVTTSARIEHAKVVLRGRLTGRRAHTRPVVELFARTRGCNTIYHRIGRARARRDGRFTVSAPPLVGVAIGVYRATARVRGYGRSYTLPQTIARR